MDEVKIICNGTDDNRYNIKFSKSKDNFLITIENNELRVPPNMLRSMISYIQELVIRRTQRQLLIDNPKLLDTFTFSITGQIKFTENKHDEYGLNLEMNYPPVAIPLEVNLINFNKMLLNYLREIDSTELDKYVTKFLQHCDDKNIEYVSITLLSILFNTKYKEKVINRVQSRAYIKNISNIEIIKRIKEDIE